MTGSRGLKASYAPGSHAALVSDGGVVLTVGDRLPEVASLDGQVLEAPTVVEALSRGVLANLPGFALVLAHGTDVRILVRGGFVVTVDGTSITGHDATMWHESSLPLSDHARIEVTSAGMLSAGPYLPMASGVVLSDSVVWSTSATSTAAPTVTFADEYTVVRRTPRAEPAPLPPAPAVPPPLPPIPAVAPVSSPGPPPAWEPALDDLAADHDGRTITPAQLQALRAQRPSTPPPLSSPPMSPTVAPPQMAPPQMAPPPVPPPAGLARPTVALELSSGRVIPIRRRVLIGRSPRIQQVGGSANLPALVTVDDPYVSSTHLEISVEGTRVTVTDMSTNGTLITQPGRLPVPLDRGVATELAIGDVLTLSKGLTATLVTAPEAV